VDRLAGRAGTDESALLFFFPETNGMELPAGCSALDRSVPRATTATRKDTQYPNLL